MDEYREGVKMGSFCKRGARESWARWKAATTRLSGKTICGYVELDGKLTCASVSKAREKISRTMKNCGVRRRFDEPWRTAANRGGSPPPRTEPWRRGAVRGANRTVGVAHGLVCERTAPYSSRFEPWSTLELSHFRQPIHHHPNLSIAIKLRQANHEIH